MRKKVGVIWGRFNPPHKGHVALVRRLAKKVDVLVIAVGGAEHNDTKRNPFSGKERVAMLKSYLREESIPVKSVIAIEDGRSRTSSIDNLFKKCGRFDILFTDHSWIANYVGGRAKVVGFRRRKGVSSTLVRDSIAKGREWESLTGKSVAALITKFNGIERIRRAYSRGK